ncbi:unnamed protein product [Polarella glacialis]|uniref:Uncharacterized protein n=1 Tax=Polarella glacialis TaxID=89957 RepID=A0A813FUK5_POLGL|nr:unnamed protein product [Polarella glacialis]
MLCWKHIQVFDAQTLQSSSTRWMANVESRQPALDGYGFLAGVTTSQGVPIAQYAGHRSVAFCKAKCNLEPLCFSFAWTEAYGCNLRTQCVDDTSSFPLWERHHVTFYQLKPSRSCIRIDEMSAALREQIYHPAVDAYGQSGSNASFFGVESGGRRRRHGFKGNFMSHLRRNFVVSKPCANCSVSTTVTSTATMTATSRTATATTRTTVTMSMTSTTGNTNTTATMTATATSATTSTTATMSTTTTSATTNTTTTSATTSTTATMTATTTSATTSTTATTSATATTSTTATMTSTTATVNVTGGSIMQEVNTSTTTVTSLTVTSSSVTMTSTTMTNTTTATSTSSTTTPPPPVRLVKYDGTIYNVGDADVSGGIDGRVEVFYTGQWGSVCKDEFGSTEATVACKELGYTFGYVGVTTSLAGTGPIWMDNVVCTGDELWLSKCESNGWGISNCYHSEDVGIYCTKNTMTSTSVTTSEQVTTTTTTSYKRTTVLGRTGFLRNKLTGRCAAPGNGAEKGTALQEKNCDFPNPGTDARWTVNDLGMISSLLYPTLCIDPLGASPSSWSKTQLGLDDCNYEMNASISVVNTEQRWDFAPDGSVVNQWSGLCLDTRFWWDPDLYFMSCPNMTLSSSSRWEFVEAVAATRKTGFLWRYSSSMCMDVDGNPGIATSARIMQNSNCDWNFPGSGTDQRWELTEAGHLQSLNSGKCLGFISNDGQLQDCILDDNVSAEAAYQLWEMDPAGKLKARGTSQCVSTANENHDTSTVTLVACEESVSLVWEFVEPEEVLDLCRTMCTHGTSDLDTYTTWKLTDQLVCECSWLLDGYWSHMDRLQFDEAGSINTQGKGRMGVISGPDSIYKPIVHSSTTRSAIADAFTQWASDASPYVANVTHDSGMTLTSPTTDFGFAYLLESEQPFVSQVLVNGVAGLNMSQGDTVTLQGGNFDGLSSSEFEVTLGLTVVPSISVSADALIFVVPTATHARLNLRVVAGWKGWADFAPLLGTSTQRKQVGVWVGNGNLIYSFTPVSGSMYGGTRVFITGKGFQLPSGLNNVTLLRPSTGEALGGCKIMTATLNSIECTMPSLNRSAWSSTQYEETVHISVNGVQVMGASEVKPAFTYGRSFTPIVLSVVPPSLSYAVTSNVTLHGYNFGLLQRQVSVTFGERTCKVWSMNETAITCQLQRSSLAQPQLCLEVRDVYNESCIVKPRNFFMLPEVLVTSKGYGEAQASSMLDTRFELHNVTPSVGSEKGGAVVTVRGVGLAGPHITDSLMVAALGTLGDMISWTDNEIVFTTRKLTLNADLVDIMVNLITAEHKCGPGQTKGDCKHGAFELGFTPNVTSLSPLSGSAGDTMNIVVAIPNGVAKNINAANVTVHLGSFECPLTGGVTVTGGGQSIQVSCTIPAFEASDVTVKVRVLPFGYAGFVVAAQETFTQVMSIQSITPNSGSNGGRKVVISGSGFSSKSARHFIRVGDRNWGTCEISSSNYTSITCDMNWRSFDSDTGGVSTEDVVVMLWDQEVAKNPLLAFGNSMVGCLKGNDDWVESNCLSEGECAQRCLLKPGCLSFEYRPVYQRCTMSIQSFTKCGTSCVSQNWPDCRYYERTSEENPSALVSTKLTQGFTYSADLTANIGRVITVPNSVRPAIQGTASGCGADAADLGAGNNGCCTQEAPCGANEGKCTNDNQCVGNLDCESLGCSWSLDSTDSQIQDSCCALRGRDDGYSQQEALWEKGDLVMIRVDSGFGSTAEIDAAVADPTNGYAKVSFGGASCPVSWIRKLASQSFVDVACTLGESPGGFFLRPQLDLESRGRASEDSEWIFMPLTVSGAAAAPDEAAANGASPLAGSSLGGGWKLDVSGVGFAPPPSAGADTYVEVAVCGKMCEVVSSSYNSVQCLVPNVTTPEVLAGGSDALVIPAARVISENASRADMITPACFSGEGPGMYEVGSPTCAAVFDGDPELTAGLSAANCHMGLDYGDFAEARVERIRFHPLYDATEADKYIGSQFQIGTLRVGVPEGVISAFRRVSEERELAAATCDELSYGWRGVGYRGCQDTASSGQKCASWSSHSASHVERNPELASHSYCRNPAPSGMQKGIWCRTERGRNEYCNPKVPDIIWTTVHTITKRPKMLWNEVVLSTPQTGRFVRLLSQAGNCKFSEIQVIGQVVSPSSSCDVAVRNVRRSQGQNLKADIGRVAWHGGVHAIDGFLELYSQWSKNSSTAQVTFSAATTPTVLSMEPNNGTARGGTTVRLTGSNFGPAWTAPTPYLDDTVVPVSVEFNQYPCKVTEVATTYVECVTGPRNQGIRPPSVKLSVAGVGNALVSPGTRWRYLDRWSQLDTWANQEPPVAGDLVMVPKGQSVLLDEDTPQLLMISVEGELVFDDTKDIHLQATYIWVKGGTMEIGTESKPFLKKATITLHGDKYTTIRLPVIGGKVLAVSNEQFTYRQGGDGAVEEGNIGTLDIHGKPRLKVWTRISETVHAGDTVIKMQEIVDWVAGEELVVVATETSHKHFDGNGLMGAPPVDFQNERVHIASVASDMKTITLTAPLAHDHISTFYVRPDGEYIDLSAEVGLLSRNVKIQGEEYFTEKDMWGGHTMVAFGGVYRIENAEFYRMGQTGEMSRYPIHFHVSQDYGAQCYAKHNSIHHSFQRAVAIHSTNYVTVLGNVAFDIVGHMYFIETGMEKYNRLEGNLGVGAIPLLSGMLESDQEPAAFWTAAPNNVWIDNVAATGSDGWYFQLSDHPVSMSMDVYKDSVCPVGDRVGEWSRNRCHHTSGSCIRVYMTWLPTKDPCNVKSGENPQILFNTTCWGVGKSCYIAMRMGSIHNHHMTSIESGGADWETVFFDRKASYSNDKHATDYLGIGHIQDSVFVGVLPQNMHSMTENANFKAKIIKLPQDENFLVKDNWFVNFKAVPVFTDCTACWAAPKWRQGAFTYRFSGLSFVNTSKRIFVMKKGIYWDIDGTLTGVVNSYTTYADAFNLDQPGCVTTQNRIAATNDELDIGELNTWPMSTTGGILDDSDSIFYAAKGVLIHSRRNYSFITCTTPIRKFSVAWPEPQEVYLRQLTVTNVDTGRFQQIEFEDKEVFGWAFPVVANMRLKVRPNLPGLDLLAAGLKYGFSDLFALAEAEAIKNKEVYTPEWFQLSVETYQALDHYKLTNPYNEFVGTRHSAVAIPAAKAAQKLKPALVMPDPLNTPELLPSMTHGMLDSRNWAVSFRYPLPAGAPPQDMEPLSAWFEGRVCPDTGCIKGLATTDFSWDTYILWSEKFGDADIASTLTIDAQDWILFDMAETVTIKNLTIFGKLSFDDSADRVLTVGNMLVWGLLEVGNETEPFGEASGKTARIVLSGSVMDMDDYMIVDEQSLHNKVIAVAGRVETYGVARKDPWLRLASSIADDDKSACVRNESGPLEWPAGAEVAFAPTEWDDPFGDTKIRTLSAHPVHDAANDCTRIFFDTELEKLVYAGDIDVGNGKTVSLRSVVARTDRTVIFESLDLDGSHYYGGHIEIFAVKLNDEGGNSRVGQVTMRNTQFKSLGKASLSAAVKIGYDSSFVPPPVNLFEGCSWTNSQEYALHAQSSNVPLIVKDNVMVKSFNGGIFIDAGSLTTQIINNAVIGVSMGPNNPVAVNEFSGGSRVINYAGIRADVVPVRMIGNVVAGSNDIGFMHQAEPCPASAIFNNEAWATIVGVFLLPLKRGNCQTANLYKVWKAAHIAVFIADVMVSNTQLSNIVVADSHLGIVPYFSVGNRFRRFYVYDSIIIGSSPASSCNGRSNFCRSQSMTDPYMASCNSLYAPGNFRKIGLVVPFNTPNMKTCWTSKDPRLCRLLGQAYPNLDDCHFPWEWENHMGKGAGWSFFERTTFAYWKQNDCGRTSRAIAPNVAGPEIIFPMTFTNTSWYEADALSKFEMSTAGLDDLYVARNTPCRSTGGGCMGLDQMLLQDTDGTLTGLAPGSTVLPYTPRTWTVWASQCVNQLDGVEINAQVCNNVTVQHLEMKNLDRGAKDVKFGPLVLTPDVEEENGFGGGVLSSVGTFYASCPCGWDFSYYHILIKPKVTYYTEVMSLPENFMLRYWSARPEDSVVLQFFYPDSRGVNVFVGDSSEPPMRLKLARIPTLADEHGAHVVDSQRLRLYITLRGSPEGFAAQRDLVIRRTPTVKLKINVEISISEFNGENFATNLAILLGIPPERIKVVAVNARRRLALVDVGEGEGSESCDQHGCSVSGGRRLGVVQATALEVSIEPSSDAAAAASGGQANSASAGALNAQTQELGQVSTQLTSLQSGSSSSLAAAAGGQVTVTEMTVPAEQDQAALADAPDAGATSAPVVIDVTAVAATSAALQVSADAPCTTAFSAMVTVGTTLAPLYPANEIANGGSSTSLCSGIDTGYQGNIALSCVAGSVSANPAACAPVGCSSAVTVTIGGTSSSVSPPANMASGITSSVACSSVHAAYSGNFQLSCYQGALSYDVSTCSPGCLTSESINITVADQVTSWSPSTDMVSGAKATEQCEPINPGYSGTVQISCFFGVMTSNPALCSPKQCSVGNTLSITLDGVTQTITLATKIKSGLTGSAACSSVNPAYGELLALSCSMGVLSYDVSACRRACPASSSISVTVGATSVSVSPTATLPAGATEYNRPCSEVSSGYDGVFSLLCEAGTLTSSTAGCTAKGCSNNAAVTVTVGSASASVVSGEALAHADTLLQLCTDVNPSYTGTVTLACSLGVLSVGSDDCAVKPCEAWHFVAGTVHGESGLLYPRQQILTGSTGVGECGTANIEYSGDVVLSCVLGALQAGDSSDCRLTCSTYGSSSQVTVAGTAYAVAPAERIPHGADGVQACSTAAFGYSGDVNLHCDNGVLSVMSNACVPDPCQAGLTLNTSIAGGQGEYTLLADTAHGSNGLADCNSGNPNLIGFFEVSCAAKKLSVVSLDGCKRNCGATSSTTLVLNDGAIGHETSVVPLAPLVHDTNASQPCSTAAPGYSGEISLYCDDGATSVLSADCIPDPCQDPRSSSFWLDENGMVPSGYTWQTPCTTLSELFAGEIVTVCSAARVMVNTSGCSGSCNTTEDGSNTELSGTEFQLDCNFIGPLYGGMMNTTCSDEVMHPDDSSCTVACGGGDTASLQVAGNSHTVSLKVRSEDGSVLQRQCAWLNPLYHGVFDLSCTRGLLSSSSKCHQLCPTTLSVQIALGGQSLTVNPPAAVEHGQALAGTCASLVAGYFGNYSFACDEGVLTASAAQCMAPCSAGTNVPVSFRGLNRALDLASQITHGDSLVQGCASAEVGYSGDFVLGCDNGVTTVRSENCYESNCPAQQAYQVSLGNLTTSSHLDGQVNHSSSFQRACPDVNMLYDGNLTVSCVKGNLIADFSTCLPSCLTSYSVSVSIGESPPKTVSPRERMVSGAMYAMQCSTFGPTYRGPISVSCSMGVVSLDQSCEIDCNTGFQIDLDDRTLNINSSGMIANGVTSTQNCPAGFSGNLSWFCRMGSSEVQSHDCVPKPCQTSVSTVLKLDGGNRSLTPEAAMQHNDSWGEKFWCISVSPIFRGRFEVDCKYGGLQADLSTCVGVPCYPFTTMEVAVGWQTATVRPVVKVNHGGEWPVSCSSINGEFLGNIQMTCFGGSVRADTSQCKQTEVGCLPTGKGVNVTKENRTGVLRSSSAVVQGQSFTQECGNAIRGWTGTIQAACGAIGSISETNNLSGCTPAPCVAGQDITFVAGGLAGNVSGSALVTSGLAHGASTTLEQCQSLDKALRGSNVPVACLYGELVADTSGCQISCLPSRKSAVVYEGVTNHVGPSQDMADGLSSNTSCGYVMPGTELFASLTCAGGLVAANLTSCTPLPCLTSSSLNVTLYETTRTVEITKELSSGSSTTRNCASVNPDYVGTMQIQCHLNALTADVSDCLCEASGCSDATCESTDQFLVTSPGAGKQFSPFLKLDIPSLTLASKPCSQALPGHTGTMTVRCSGGAIAANASQCIGQPCSASKTAPLKVIYGGVVATLAVTRDMPWGSTFDGPKCDPLSASYGVITGRCFGDIIEADTSTCVPKPCEDSTRTLDFAGVRINVPLSGALLGAGQSPATPGWTKAGLDCKLLSSELAGSFALTCTEGAFLLNSSSCRPIQCTVPSSATATIGGSSMVISLTSAVEPGSWETFSCGRLGNQYSGDGRLVCLEGILSAETSACTSVSTSSSAPCVASTSSLVKKGNAVSVDDLETEMASGTRVSQNCSEVLPGHSGSAASSCSSGIYSTDASSCIPDPCSPQGHVAIVALGGQALNFSAPSTQQSGSSWTLDCSSLNKGFVGTATGLCSLGKVSGDVSACSPQSCKDGERTITFTDNQSTGIFLSGSQLGGTSPAPDGFKAAEMACSALLAGLDGGSVRIECRRGDFVVDASSCRALGCGPATKGIVRMGSKDVSVPYDSNMASGDVLGLPCSALRPGWSGTVRLGCSFAQLAANASACSPAECPAGMSPTVVVGSTVTQIRVNDTMQSFGQMVMPCSRFDATYEGEMSIVCEAGGLRSNTSACTPLPQAGKTMKAVETLQSAVAFQLPTVPGATAKTMQAAMGSPEAKGALAKSLAQGLGAATEDVTILEIRVYEAVSATLSKVSRRLDAALEMEVTFQLRASGSSGLIASISSLGDASSPQNQLFTSNLGPNLQEAAEASPTSLLAQTAAAVKTQGVTVKRVDAPKTVMVYVMVDEAPTTAESTSDDNLAAILAVSIVCSIFGIGAALFCLYVAYRASRGIKLSRVLSEERERVVWSDVEVQLPNNNNDSLRLEEVIDLEAAPGTPPTLQTTAVARSEPELPDLANFWEDVLPAELGQAAPELADSPDPEQASARPSTGATVN